MVTKRNIDIIQNIIGDDNISRIDNMINYFKKNKNIEFEISFRKINYTDYIRISEHYVNLSNDINHTVSLDISMIYSDGNVYRVSLLNDEKINNFLSKYSKLKYLEIIKYIMSIDSDENTEIMLKNRGNADRLVVEDINMIAKTTEEIPITKSRTLPELSGREKLLYRYKDRYSFTLDNDVRIDITDVKETPNIWELSKKNSNYEIEMEFTNNKKINLDLVLDKIYDIVSVVQNTDNPISNSEGKQIISEYQKLLGVKSSNHLDSRNVVSIESQHIVKFIPNKYAVTDKADGERYFLFSTSLGIYLLSTNLVVKKLNMDPLKNQFLNMIIDGELININGKYIFMAFDVVYYDDIDYRYANNYTLTHRIKVLDTIIDKAFGNLIVFNEYTDKHNNIELDEIKKYYTNEIKSYWKNFNKKLNNHNGFFVSRKLYFVPYGIDPSEVFMYADLLWKLCVYDQLTPYKLDGIIYTPINTPYMIKASPGELDSIPMEYKWKPPAQNSIDFYIKFNKDAMGAEAIYYDNSVVRGEGKPYKICGLYVGLIKSGQELPIPFKVSGIEQKANIYLTNDEALDVEGNVITDNTVVEFVYDNLKKDMEEAYKWIPIRTRYDKTESVQKYGKKYGNNLNIATRIWRTIVNPVTEESIAALADPDNYEKEMTKLSKIHESRNKPTFTYYQKTTSSATGMRAFNNFIKSNMILTYCRNKKSVLDIGMGRGGDLIKFINANVEEYVGVDIDNNGLYFIDDSAFNRYKNLKKNNNNIPPMKFINADARGLFTVEAQEKILPNMSDTNAKMITNYLSGSKQYDAINCQFNIHYYLSDKTSWKNFCKNINDHLKDNGYLLITCFDGQLIYDKLKNKQKYTASYTDNHGNKNIFFEINKVYSDQDKKPLGMAIDLYNSLISNQGTYIREYLVFPDFLQKSLHEMCGLELVETDMFFNIFNLYKNYFKGSNGEFTSNDMSSKKYNEIKNFYLSLEGKIGDTTDSDISMASFKLSMLNRYYIFKKKTTINVTEASRIVSGVNNKTNLGKILVPYFHTNNMIIDYNTGSQDINKIYHHLRKKYSPVKPSVYLVRHNIIDDLLDDVVFSRNKLEFTKIKNGKDPKILLIYKSPDKLFYPFYYQQYETRNLSHDYSSDNIYMKDNGTYLLDADKIVKDLNLLVNLSEKMH
ncbi:mRNA cap guanine-N7 methyltransferase [Megavirus chiliensis]|uniref:mRNA capping enzyme n=4 Tax=Megamimivirinae TaxID=3044648 RepID=A0A2L2DMF6_MIMIV|nr:putative mRNA capping enzyme [Megavirus chiliensis]AEQ33424.1 mRNA cap guanine-N7 methyltransferase [Megavirus chiliensis]AVG47351.1 mRNA capping enzyme [Acanthamoeba polyphaga mimivirus]